MKIIKWGVDGGKPSRDGSAFPGMFFKGAAAAWVAPEEPLELPSYALDGGEEVEVVGLLPDRGQGRGARVGFALGNEYADHAWSARNYLYLRTENAPVQLRPELLVGEMPKSVSGRARLMRDGREIWAEEWLSGEDNMSIPSQSRTPHFQVQRLPSAGRRARGISSAPPPGSFTKRSRPGWRIEISSRSSGRPLRNRLVRHRKTGKLNNRTQL